MGRRVRTGEPATWDAARLTVGGVLAAVDAVLDGRVRRALVHARPAGHHAEPDRAIASTYLNNVACGVEARPGPGVERVAIIDWDVHVANGAERIFWDRDDVLAISLHQQDWYPAHAGALRATGGSGAQGSTVNVPLPPATTDAGYRLAFDEIVAPIVRAFRPDLIMVAAGQDASVFDPTARMLVSAAGFRALAERVAQLADELTGGRLVASTEGGYSPIYNPFCLLGVLEGLAGESAGSPTRGTTTPPSAPRERRPTTASGLPGRRAGRPAALVSLTEPEPKGWPVTAAGRGTPWTALSSNPARNELGPIAGDGSIVRTTAVPCRAKRKTRSPTSRGAGGRRMEQ